MDMHVRCLQVIDAFSTSTGHRKMLSRLRRFSSCASKLAATQKWFDAIVLGEKLCPFAPPLMLTPDLLRITSSNATTTLEAVRDISLEVEALVGNENEKARHETTLVVLNFTDFVRDFRDFVRLSWILQEEAVGELHREKLQIVLFHPEATHQTYSETSSAADYTIRSPYPTVHLLREQDVMRAVQSGYPYLDTLPMRNQEKLLKQGVDVCQRRLEACMIGE